MSVRGTCAGEIRLRPEPFERDTRGPTIEQSKRYQAGYEKACRNDEISHQMISGAREAVAFWSMRGDGSADYWRGWLAGLIKSQTTTAS